MSDLILLNPFRFSQEFSTSYPSGLSAWYDATDAATITEVAGAVSQWNDKSTSNLDVVQATGSAQPTTGTTTINSLNVLAFDGGDVLAHSGATGWAAGNQTVFFVGYSTTTTANEGFVAAHKTTGNDYDNLGAWAINSGTGTTFVHVNRKVELDAFGYLGDGATPAAVWAVRMTNDGLINIYRDGGDPTYKSSAGQTWETPNGGIVLGGRFLGSVSASYRLNGALGEVLVYDRALTSQEMDSVGTYLADKWGFTWTTAPVGTWQAMFEGDSISAEPPTGGDISIRQMTLTATNYGLARNTATPGGTIPAMLAEADTQIDPFYIAYMPSVLSFFAGTNDIAVLEHTGTETHTDYATYCSDRQAVGWQVLAYTMLPRGAADPFEAERQIFNGLVRDNWETYADALVDVGGDPFIGAPGQNTDPDYYDDVVHPNDAGRAIIGEYVVAAFLELGHT